MCPCCLRNIPSTFERGPRVEREKDTVYQVCVDVEKDITMSEQLTKDISMFVIGCRSDLGLRHSTVTDYSYKA